MIGRECLVLRPTHVVDEVVVGRSLDRQIRLHCESLIVQWRDHIESIVGSLKLRMAAVPFDVRRRLAVRDCARQHQVLVFLHIDFAVLLGDNSATR